MAGASRRAASGDRHRGRHERGRSQRHDPRHELRTRRGTPGPQDAMAHERAHRDRGAVAAGGGLVVDPRRLVLLEEDPRPPGRDAHDERAPPGSVAHHVVRDQHRAGGSPALLPGFVRAGLPVARSPAGLPVPFGVAVRRDQRLREELRGPRARRAGLGGLPGRVRAGRGVPGAVRPRAGTPGRAELADGRRGARQRAVRAGPRRDRHAPGRHRRAPDGGVRRALRRGGPPPAAVPASPRRAVRHRRGSGFSVRP